MVQWNGNINLPNLTNIQHKFDQTKKTSIEGNFSQLLAQTLNHVNQTENKANDMQLQAILDPKSVQLHEVTVLMSKASMGVMITKSVTERVINAYKAITNMR